MSTRALFVAAITAGATIVCCAIGCDKKNDTSAATSASALSDQDTPVPADFADEAATQITKDNYKSELEKISGEMDKD